MGEMNGNGLIDTWIATKLEQGELSKFGASLYRPYLKRLLGNMGLTPEQALERAKTDINGLWTQAKNTNGMTAAGRHKSLLAFRNFLRFNGFYPPADKLSHKKQREERKKRGQDVHSLVADPMFADPENADFTLRPDSPAAQIGFHPIDLSQVGPRH